MTLREQIFVGVLTALVLLVIVGFASIYFADRAYEAKSHELDRALSEGREEAREVLDDFVPPKQWNVYSDCPADLCFKTWDSDEAALEWTEDFFAIYDLDVRHLGPGVVPGGTGIVAPFGASAITVMVRPGVDAPDLRQTRVYIGID